MRILIATDTFPVVSQTFIALHCSSLAARGHEVCVLARPAPAWSAANDDGGIRLLPAAPPAGSRSSRMVHVLGRLPKTLSSLRLARVVLVDVTKQRNPGHNLDTFTKAALLSEEPPFDIVHAHFSVSSIQSAELKAAGVLRAPLVATFHGTDLNYRGAMDNCRRYARVFRQAGYLTVGSHHMTEHFTRCHIPADRYGVIPMGIDLSRFRPAERSSGSGVRVVTIGRLIECKGTEYALRAVARLKATLPNITLDVIGDGPLRAPLEQLARDLAIVEEVTFHGALPHSETLAMLQQGDIYLHPGVVASDGTREGQGLTIAEAAAMRLPVVTTRVGGIPESVDEGRSAFVVEPGDVDALAHSIQLLVNNPELRATMGAAGRAFVEQHLDQNVLVDRWIALYERLIAEGTRT